MARRQRSENDPRSGSDLGEAETTEIIKETKMDARVDLNKLQILNDRICQTIDALNQVRLSVRAVPQVPGIAASPLGTQSVGFQHSTPWYGAMQSVSPWSNPLAVGLGGINPMAALSPLGLQHSSPSYGVSPYFPQGLQHTSSDVYDMQLAAIRAQDPFRVAQTFPFAFTPLF